MPKDQEMADEEQNQDFRAMLVAMHPSEAAKILAILDKQDDESEYAEKLGTRRSKRLARSRSRGEETENAQAILGDLRGLGLYRGRLPRIYSVAFPSLL
jgi:hypothetical protein